MSNQSNCLSDQTLDLGLNLRNDLLRLINNLTSSLHFKSIQLEDKKDLIKSVNDMISKLSILSVNKSSTNENLFNGLNKDSVFYELSWVKRRDLVDQLTKNLAYLYGNLVSDSTRDELSKENNSLNHEILDLKIRNQSEGNNTCMLFDRPPKRTKIEYELSDLIRKYDELEAKIKSVDIRNPYAKFDFVVKKVKELIDDKKEAVSEYFFCNSIQWYVTVCPNEEEYVDLFLYVQSDGVDYEDYDEWEVRASFTFKLIHWDNPNLNKSVTLDNVLMKRDTGKGTNNFISYLELEDYIKDNKINVQIELKADRLYQTREIE